MCYDFFVWYEFCYIGEKFFECDICKVIFVFKDYFECYMCKYLGIKVVSCLICGRECCDYNSLRWYLVIYIGMCYI